MTFLLRHVPIGILANEKTVNTLMWRQNAVDIFKLIFLNETCCIFIQTSLNSISIGSNENKSLLAQIIAWGQTGDTSLPEPLMASIDNTNMCQ